MECTCQHCRANLDEGDILEHFLLKYGDYTKAKERSRFYGRMETNKTRFNRSIIMQPKKGSQYTVCPDCKKTDTLLQEITK